MEFILHYMKAHIYYNNAYSNISIYINNSILYNNIYFEYKKF